jgi:hypothetical protein
MKIGAHDWNRTNDLLLTKEVLYRLSYGGGDVLFTLALLNDGYTNDWCNSPKRPIKSLKKTPVTDGFAA